MVKVLALNDVIPQGYAFGIPNPAGGEGSLETPEIIGILTAPLGMTFRRRIYADPVLVLYYPVVSSAIKKTVSFKDTVFLCI